jgi:hypothetical protein
MVGQAMAGSWYFAVTIFDVGVTSNVIQPRRHSLGASG